MKHTTEELNAVLAGTAVQVGYCLCLAPMRTVVNCAGMRCSLCGYPITDAWYKQETKTLRGRVLLAAFPDLANLDG